ncbi:hypothetical protein BDN70DRAFT_992208, partial [Pholiota conissans]
MVRLFRQVCILFDSVTYCYVYGTFGTVGCCYLISVMYQSCMLCMLRMSNL